MKLTYRFPTETYGYIEAEYADLQDLEANHQKVLDAVAREIARTSLNSAPTSVPVVQNVQPPQMTRPTPIQGFTGTCQDCNAVKVKNPKTGKMFCPNKCFLKKQPF